MYNFEIKNLKIGGLNIVTIESDDLIAAIALALEKVARQNGYNHQDLRIDKAEYFPPRMEVLS